MLWDEVVGHSSIKQSLKRVVERGRINHAYLFSGPSAVGKHKVSLIFASAVLCAEGGCGECSTCRRVMEGKHPDVQVLKPSGKNIPVEDVRRMRLSAFRKPVEADRKFYVMKNAERMWDEGASTLLKILEEPPGNVVFILLTSNPAALLPTIRSRCQEVTFSLIPVEELSDYLCRMRQMPADRAELIARLTGGVLGRALDWSDEPWRLARRENVLRAARALRRAGLDRTLETAQALYRDVRAPVEEVAERYRERRKELSDGSLDESFVRTIAKELDEEARREQMKEEIRGVKEVLSTLAFWYRDILLIKVGGDPDMMVNQDHIREIEEEAATVPLEKIIVCIELIEESSRAADQNVPAQLNMESTLLGLQEALYA